MDRSDYVRISWLLSVNINGGSPHDFITIISSHDNDELYYRDKILTDASRDKQQEVANSLNTEEPGEYTTIIFYILSI